MHVNIFVSHEEFYLFYSLCLSVKSSLVSRLNTIEVYTPTSE